MIKDLTIQGYRCFENFSMNGLTRINLLVGNNNTGKTSFLEAVYLLVNQPSLGTVGKSLKEIFENRSEFGQQIETIDHESEPFITRRYYIDRLFYNYGQDKVDKLKILNTQDTSISTTIAMDDDSEALVLFYLDDKLSFPTEENEIEDIVFIKIFLFSSQGKIDECIGKSAEIDQELSINDLNKKKDFSHIIHSSLFFHTVKWFLRKLLKFGMILNLLPKKIL